VERGPEKPVLDQLIFELQQEPGPEFDWRRAEARLMRELPPLQQSAGRSLWKRLRLPAAGLTAATTLAAVVVTRSPAPRPAAPAARLSSVALNGDKFALGTRIAAGNQPVVIEHRGRARWELEPHSAASVTNRGEFLTLQLEVGALSANVVPSPKAETFAVEVGGTRVAVHGTAFRVEYGAERVLVSVSEGTVAVEPVGSRSAPAFLLRRDSRGSFALDGHTGSVEGNASALVNHVGAPSHREIAALARPAAFSSHANLPVARAAPVAASALPGARAANLPLQPAIADIETGVSSALELMNRCFRDKTQSSGIKVSVSTGLTLSVSGDGTVQSVTFAPSLAPAVEDCAVLGLRNLSFARSVDGVSFTRVFELSR
jgi:FecR protein